MFSTNRQGERRVSGSTYRLLLATHVIVSGAWLGVVVAKIVVGLAAMRSGEPSVILALVGATDVLNAAFPPLAIATIATGVLLSLGTKWGLLKHYWVATKLVLSVAVIATAVQLGDRLGRQFTVVATAATLDTGPLLSAMAAPIGLLVALSVAHLLMLGAASVLSVYKPWGKIWFGRNTRQPQTRMPTANESSRSGS